MLCGLLPKSRFCGSSDLGGVPGWCVRAELGLALLASLLALAIQTRDVVNVVSRVSRLFFGGEFVADGFFDSLAFVI